MGDEITLVSTTDSEADIRAALKLPPVAAPAPAAEPPPAAVPPAAAPAAAEADEADDDEQLDPQATSEAGRTLAAAAKRSRTETRIAQLTKERREEAARAAAAEARAKELERQLAEARKPATPPTEEPPVTAKVEPPAPPVTAKAFDKPRPKQEDFDDFEAYEVARDAWILEKSDFDTEQRIEARLDAREKARVEAEQKRQAEEAQRTRTETFVARVDAMREQRADFDEVVASVSVEGAPQLPQAIIEYLQESEHGPALVYHLGKHPDELKALSQMLPAKAFATLGRYEAQQAAGVLVATRPASTAETTTEAPAPAAAAPARRVAVSSAPPPLPRVEGGAAAVNKDPNTMTHAEYKRWREQSIAARRSKAS